MMTWSRSATSKRLSAWERWAVISRSLELGGGAAAGAVTGADERGGVEAPQRHGRALTEALREGCWGAWPLRMRRRRAPRSALDSPATGRSGQDGPGARVRRRLREGGVLGGWPGSSRQVGLERAVASAPADVHALTGTSGRYLARRPAAAGVERLRDEAGALTGPGRTRLRPRRCRGQARLCAEQRGRHRPAPPRIAVSPGHRRAIRRPRGACPCATPRAPPPRRARCRGAPPSPPAPRRRSGASTGGTPTPSPRRPSRR